MVKVARRAVMGWFGGGEVRALRRECTGSRRVVRDVILIILGFDLSEGLDWFRLV